MRIKIIANKPISANCSGIDHLIGQEFDVDYITEDGHLRISADTGIYIFPDEYEIVENN